jgi:AraC-like DNA-binding protein
MLARTDKSVTTVALECGYGTLDHFIRTFKRRTGRTPLRFRRESSR